ncbi:hypothetical protein EET67_22485 [Pseudaminobacter arsenicus]|uniref:Uncharacterized protein n=1 Tax=Borborobacter arsenicus TaxID=1851146 RepID=A0A432V0B3_9HYPH|nr:hypothetical protein [Pseudaminobacter arsenicus]RUM95600.1 hypothetical protein EET67_22485 [Pseudaminobacter arsenicus]
MELVFPHRISYRDGTASIDEAIENLKAQKRLLEEGVRFLDLAVPNMTVESVRIRVVSVASGSLVSDLAVILVTTYQEDLEGKIVGGIEAVFGVDIPAEYEALVTLSALAVTYLVARYAYDAVRSKKPDRPASTHIEGDYNTVVNVISDKINLPTSSVENALNEAIPQGRRRSLIKSVTKFLKPREDGVISPVTVGGVGEISPETLKEYPSDSELAEIDESRNVDLPSALLDIRATDRDKNTTGWAAVIIGDKRFKKRMQMDLYPTVDAAALAKKERVKADVTVEGDRRADGSFVGKRIHLLKVLPDA